MIIAPKRGMHSLFFKQKVALYKTLDQRRELAYIHMLIQEVDEEEGEEEA